jgi:hypothetical protein
MKPAASVSAAPARCSPFPTGNSISFFRSNLNIIETCFKLHLVLKVSDGDIDNPVLTAIFDEPSPIMIQDQIDIKQKFIIRNLHSNEMK